MAVDPELGPVAPPPSPSRCTAMPAAISTISRSIARARCAMPSALQRRAHQHFPPDARAKLEP
eukprot:1778049-Pyramimonas_sp.AAC.1